MSKTKKIICHKCGEDVTNSYWVWYYGDGTMPTCRDCNGGVETELEVIDYTLQEHHLSVILAWMEEYFPEETFFGLEKRFKDWLLKTPEAYREFQCQYGELYRLKKLKQGDVV